MHNDHRTPFTETQTRRARSAPAPRFRLRALLGGTRLRCAALWPLLAALGEAALGQGTVVIDRPVPAPWRPDRVTTTPLLVKYQRIVTQITDGVAMTTVDQTFANPLATQVEGTYVYPLPEGVAVGDFSMTAGGKTLRGEVLERDAARRTYEQIVRRTRDPALLEYLNARLYQASIFPIPPGGTLEVRLQYAEALSESGGLGQFRHPFAAPGPDGPPVEQLVVQVKLRSSLPLASVFCPSHAADVVRRNDHEATVAFEQVHARPDRDFLVCYQRKDATFGITVLTHRAAGEEGYYMLRVSPRIEPEAGGVLPKDVALVIDTSGSMAGGKIEQAKRAVEFCINSLNADDRFNVYAFATDVRSFRDGLVPVGAEVRGAALEFVGGIQARGGTNINQALLTALAADPKDAERPYLLVFVTDGEPTVDVTDPELIRRNVRERNAGRARIHVLGVGAQVNTHLLDGLAEDARGSRDYCGENENLELKLGALVTRLSNPVLTDIVLNLPGIDAHDQYPRAMPDLFRGGDLVVLGRYAGEGRHRIELSGRLLGGAQTLTQEGDFPRLNADNDFLPRLWANRKIAYLLDEIRLRGQKQELVDEVVRLAKRHGIVTPYTSALILEDEAQLAREGGRRLGRPPAPAAPVDRVILERARALGGRGDESGQGAVDMLRGAPVGRGAVRASQDVAAAMSLEYVGGAAFDSPEGRDTREAAAVVRHVGGKTFILDGQRWVDTAWDGKREPRKLTAFSDAYFELLAARPELGRVLALGPRVLVVVGEEVIETVLESPGGADGR